MTPEQLNAVCTAKEENTETCIVNQMGAGKPGSGAAKDALKKSDWTWIRSTVEDGVDDYVVKSAAEWAPDTAHYSGKARDYYGYAWNWFTPFGWTSSVLSYLNGATGFSDLSGVT